jgi:hypothetical protein
VTVSTESVSCPTSSRCVAAENEGLFEGLFHEVAVWSGSGEWKGQEYETAPDGEKAVLAAVSCIGSTVCHAVGWYTDFNVAGRILPISAHP